MEKELIEQINNDCPSEQGIFFQPYGIPDGIEEMVVYSRYETGGRRGGNCWGNKAEAYAAEQPKEHMKVLDILLEKIAPQITFLQYRKIQELVHDSEETDWEYYGNSTDWRIEYIVLSELEELLQQFTAPA